MSEDTKVAISQPEAAGDRIEVTSAQHISRMCFICGTENSFGLHSQFLNLADGRAASIFTASEEHQGYPGRMHGGIISAVLDELIGRILQVTDPTMFAVTVELNVKLRKPVPLHTEVKAVAWTTRDSSRIFEGEAELYLPDGTVAAQAFAKYMKMDVSRISDPADYSDADWVIDMRPVPAFISLGSDPGEKTLCR
jgi:acyl-coenzyme A thioesterase PaaI-like protein